MRLDVGSHDSRMRGGNLKVVVLFFLITRTGEDSNPV